MKNDMKSVPVLMLWLEVAKATVAKATVAKATNLRANLRECPQQK